MSNAWISALANIGTALAGAPASVISATETAVSGFFSALKSQVTTMLNTIVTNYTDPAVVANMVMQLKELSNLSQTSKIMVGTLPALAAAAAADPTKLSALLQVSNTIATQL